MLPVICIAGLVVVLRRLPKSDRPFDTIRTWDLALAVLCFLGPSFAVALLAAAFGDTIIYRLHLILTALFYVPAVPLTIWLLRRGREPRPTLGLGRTEWIRCGVAMLLAAAVFWYPISTFGALWRLFLESAGFQTTPQDAIISIRNEVSIPIKAASIAVACSIIPFAEEIIFRGFLHQTLRRHLGTAAAVATSSAAFALAHRQMLVAVPVFFVGVILAVTYERTRSLYYPIAFHAFYNASMLLAGLLTGEL